MGFRARKGSYNWEDDVKIGNEKPAASRLGQRRTSLRIMRMVKDIVEPEAVAFKTGF